jgi:hypothetical protein
MVEAYLDAVAAPPSPRPANRRFCAPCEDLLRILLDTNVVLDVLLARQPYSKASAAVWAAIETGQAATLAVTSASERTRAALRGLSESGSESAQTSE